MFNCFFFPCFFFVCFFVIVVVFLLNQNILNCFYRDFKLTAYNAYSQLACARKRVPVKGKRHGKDTLFNVGNSFSYETGITGSRRCASRQFGSDISLRYLAVSPL